MDGRLCQFLWPLSLMVRVGGGSFFTELNSYPWLRSQRSGRRMGVGGGGGVVSAASAASHPGDEPVGQ